MPPKTRITKEMIIDTAFDIARKEGANRITARSISEQLDCSTQPILYHFQSVEEIKRHAYQKADAFHTEYIMNMEKNYSNPMLTIGMNYIRFAIEENCLFHFLFQSNVFSEKSILELIYAEEVLPVISMFRQEIGVSLDCAKEIFRTLFIYIHGYASLYANNEIVFDETLLITSLKKVFYGAVYAAREVKDEETV